MGMNRERGAMEGSLVKLRKEDENCRQIIKNSRFKLFAQKNLNITLFFERNLNTFIASIYMENRKALKERMRIVCCLRYGKGEYPGKEVMQIVEATTRGRERSPQVHSLCLNRKKDPQPESPGTLKLSSSSSLEGSPSHW